MWARDLLPQVLDCKENPNGYCSYNGTHMHGRYSTFGYQAKVLDPDNVPVSIADSARGLLDAISFLRPKVIGQDRYLHAYTLNFVRRKIKCMIGLFSSFVTASVV